MKCISPYNRLKTVAISWADKVIYAHKVHMFTYSNAKSPNNTWGLDDLYQRAVASHALGYEVIVEIKGEDLVFWHRKKAPELPWELRK